MTTITMTGFNQQKRIDALQEALSHLNKICGIVYEQEPTATEINLLPDYYRSWFETESHCGYLLIFLSDAIGALVADDVANAYSHKTELSDK